MRWFDKVAILLTCGAMLIPAAASAETTPHRRHPRIARAASSRPPSPSQDAIELATLAPPSNVATIEQTYGDASYARRRLEHRIEGEVEADRVEAATYGGVPYPCDPRYPTTSATVCNGAPHARSYGQGYAFTPGYLSAPQGLGVPADEQSPLLAPITGLSWIVNGFRPDAHN